MSIPASVKGYRVDPFTGAIHTRYATHASHLPRTKTAEGAASLLGDVDPRPCAECFPGTRKPAPRTRTIAPRPTSVVRTPEPEAETLPPAPELAIDEGA
jgi:hypothetical protein